MRTLRLKKHDPNDCLTCETFQNTRAQVEQAQERVQMLRETEAADRLLLQLAEAWRDHLYETMIEMKKP